MKTLLFICRFIFHSTSRTKIKKKGALIVYSICSIRKKEDNNLFYQTWLQKNPELKSVQDVVKHNTGIKIQEFLNPKRNPFLSTLTEAVAFVKSVIEQGSTVSIVGDYDVDGVCATTIMYLGIMKYSGVEPHVRIPRRFSEGYGISTKIINEIESGLVITVDNGIAALEQIRVAKEKGLKVLVTDHHLPIMDEDTGKTILPDADIIVAE